MELGLSCTCTPSERVKQLRSRLAANSSTRKNVETLFSALGDETRLKMLELMGDEELCACEVMAALELTQPTTSHHLGILERAGLLTSRKEGRWVFYKLANQRLRSLIKGAFRLKENAIV